VGLKEALVLSARSGHFLLHFEDGGKAVASARKKVMSASQNMHQIIAGDKVMVSQESDACVIEKRLERKTVITRGSEKRRGRVHAIVANVDHALVVFAANQPRSRIGGIDRYLIACEFQNLEVSLVFNKWDLNDEQALRLVQIYERAGYCVLKTEALLNPSRTKKTILNLPFERLYVLGPSGVGKSSLLNAILEDHRAETGEVNVFSGKGRHTTTHIELCPLEDGRFVSDTPGLGQLVMLGIEPHNLRNFYREFVALAKRCKYHNCLHIDEPHCCVKDAVGTIIHEERYRSYLDFYANLCEEYESEKQKGSR